MRKMFSVSAVLLLVSCIGISDATCAAGSYIEDDGTCTLVPIGKYQPYANNDKYYGCPWKSTTFEEGAAYQSLCICQTGMWMNEQAGWLPQYNQWVWRCQDCPIGAYKSDTGSNVCTECSYWHDHVTTEDTGSLYYSDCDCEAGYFYCRCQSGWSSCLCDARGESSRYNNCVMCPAGTYKPEIGDVGCLPCAEGMQSNDDALACSCIPGFILNATSQTCTNCSTGSVPTTTTTTRDGVEIELEVCSCIEGYTLHSGGENVDVCIGCGAGTYKNTVGGDFCTSCPKNTESLPRSDDITDCNCKLRYSDWTVDGCTYSPCPVNTYMTTDGNCLECPTNTISDAESMQLSQCICDLGYTHIEDGLACAECEEGTFKNITGAVQCTICPYHMKSSVASVSESDCKCVAGYYGESCIPCPRGTTSRIGAETKDDCLCMPGWVLFDGECTPCPSGSYKLGLGDGVCTNCSVV
jgi:hypothetical protein